MKKYFFPLFILGLLAMSPQAFAKTAITGTAYGHQIGLIHMDYTTASEALPDPGIADFTAQVYDLGDETAGQPVCENSSCPLSGFMWSDTVGWIIVDGEQIRSALPSADEFPEALFARAHYNGLNPVTFTGFVWSEYGGWIKLSAGTGTGAGGGTSTPTASQTVSDWGVFLNPADDTLTEGEEVIGRTLKGNAWSDNLGWIAFEKVNPDFPAFGVFTSWIPDADPPILAIVSDTWLANESAAGTIAWAAIASDPQSGIKPDPDLSVSRDADTDFAGCDEPVLIGREIVSNSLSLSIPSVGNLKNASLGYCKYRLSGSISNNAGLSTDVSGMTFYVRPGDVNEEKTRIVPPVTSANVADGEQEITYELHLTDIADNPILPIDDTNCPGCSVTRSVEVNGKINHQMRFDDLSHTGPSALYVSSLNADQFGENLVPLIDSGGASVPAPIAPVGGRYPLTFSSYAPTTSTNTLSLESFEVSLTEPDGTEKNYSIENTSKVIDFEPGLTATNGEVRTGDLVNQVMDGLPAVLSFRLNNLSPTLNLNIFDADTIFEFYTTNGGIGDALSKTHDITSTNEDDAAGWLDPTLPLTGAHFELYSSPALSATSAPLRNYSAAYPDSAAGLDSLRGTYLVDESYEEIPNLTIDRSDALSTSFAPEAFSQPAPQINFTPAYMIGGTGIDVSDVALRIQQKIGYRYENQPVFTFYEPDPLVSGINVESTGLSFEGLGAGKDIYSGGTLDVVDKTALPNLQETMRRNVADLTLGTTACDPAIAPFASDGAGHLTLKTSGSCVKNLSGENVLAYYEKTDTGLLTLGNSEPQQTLFIPDGLHYTLIVRGANVLLANNLAYRTDDSSASLGIIALKNDRGEGGNVFIHPAITNAVGNLYAEGSILSSPDGSTLYYGGAGNAQDLKNQLYWQGSISSLNTIGGAGGNTVPAGLTCEAGVSLHSCAERYDLNYLRRFAAGESSIVNGGSFSGGGQCQAGSCTPGSLPTTISFKDVSGIQVIDKSNSKSLDAFYIEPVSRPYPPGFSRSTEQKSSNVIR